MFTFDFLLSKKKVLFAYSECNAVSNFFYKQLCIVVDVIVHFKF